MKNNFQKIVVRGARVHNLKNISVEIPKNKLVVVTGVSGSGKSSLAFDTLYAEGQRRYIESFSSYARQFLRAIEKPDVDKIEGLPPAISISQHSVSNNPRSTVGTMTEIYDWLRLLFSRIGIPYCPKCKKPLMRQSATQIAKKVLNLSCGSQVFILAPIHSFSSSCSDNKENSKAKEVLKKLKDQGFVRVRILPLSLETKKQERKIYHLEEALNLNFNEFRPKSIEVVIDKFTVYKKDPGRIRVVDSIETSLKLGNGIMIAQVYNGKNYQDLIFSNQYICNECGIKISEIEPRLFSFNSPHGACPACAGLGVKLEIEPDLIIPNKRLSLAEGAIRPWSKTPYKIGTKNLDWQALEGLAKKYKFSLNEPVKNFSKNIIDLILYGEKAGGFEGVISNLERQYQETDSDHKKSEIEKYMISKICPVCKGKKLKPEALAVTITGNNIDDIVNMSIEDCNNFFKGVLNNKKESTTNSASRRTRHNTLDLSREKIEIAKPIIEEIIKQLQLLIDVNLEYLYLKREAPSLSAGEAQRIRLATQIGSKLTSVLYVLDEPSIGLHPRDQLRLIKALKNLRDIGNTVLVVEHDNQTIKKSDWIIDVGPGAGNYGGEIIFQGKVSQLLKAKTPTGDYLSDRKKIQVSQKRVENKKQKNTNQKLRNKNHLTIKGAKEHNLKDIDVNIPLNVITCITGVSGSGKSTLVNDILAKALLKKFHRANTTPGEHKEITGLANLNKVIVIDQSPIGRTPRSNPATYTGTFNYIRDLFVNTKQAKSRGYKAGHFSFNVKGGRCEECQGAGWKKIEMHLLPDRYIECPECHGKRYNKEILEIKYGGKDIAEVLDMTINEALNFFKGIAVIRNKLSILKEVGLGYLELGQPATSLSGGEAQRVKLATELSRKDTSRTIYILDEPTTGLHPADINNLLNVLTKLVKKGNTVLIIEHNLDIIKNADWVIDLGPEGGDKGGYVVAKGTPNQIKKIKSSHTGQWLKK